MAVCQVPCTCRCWYCCLQCSELLGAFYISIKHWETKDFFPKLEGILISISLPEPVSSSVLLLTKWSGVINPFFILRSAACYKPPAHQVSCWYPQAPRPIHWCSFFVFQIGTEGLPPFTPVEMQHWLFWLRKISLASVCCTGLEIFWLFPILLLSSVWVQSCGAMAQISSLWRIIFLASCKLILNKGWAQARLDL